MKYRHLQLNGSSPIYSKSSLFVSVISLTFNEFCLQIKWYRLSKLRISWFIRKPYPVYDGTLLMTNWPVWRETPYIVQFRRIFVLPSKQHSTQHREAQNYLLRNVVKVHCNLPALHKLLPLSSHTIFLTQDEYKKKLTTHNAIQSQFE